MSLSQEQVAALCGFDQATIDAFNTVVQNNENVDAVSASGACSLTRMTTELTVSGTKAYTLAAPTLTGQRKVVRCVSASNTPIGTLTVSSPDDTTGYVCAATFVFQAAGQEIVLEATPALKWRCISKKRVGVLAVEIGVTELAGYSMSQTYACAVDGTDTSTGTKGLPNGSAVGERCTVTCSLAANTPVGNIDGTFMGMLGNAYTHLGAIGVVASTTVVGDCAVLEWSGTAWQVMYQNGCTLS